MTKIILSPQGYCPACDMKAVEDNYLKEKVKAGDITVCFFCGTILIFKEDLKSRKMNLGDLEQYSKRMMNEVFGIQKSILDELQRTHKKRLAEIKKIVLKVRKEDKNGN